MGDKISYFCRFLTFFLPEKFRESVVASLAQKEEQK